MTATSIMLLVGLLYAMSCFRPFAPLQQQQQQHDQRPNAVAVSTPSSSASHSAYSHEDFLLLAEKDLHAFGVTHKPGPSGSDDEVAACLRQVSTAYRRLSLAWHEDKCKYREFMLPWQCDRMWQMAQERVKPAKDLCLNQKQTRERAESRRQEQLEERRRTKSGMSG
ncbi:hypothetical protein BKA81DRAFT_228759 [Phyllosticta paracitricarpa]